MPRRSRHSPPAEYAILPSGETATPETSGMPRSVRSAPLETSTWTRPRPPSAETERPSGAQAMLPLPTAPTIRNDRVAPPTLLTATSPAPYAQYAIREPSRDQTNGPSDDAG